LCKEANYALNDLDPKKDWGLTAPEIVEHFKKWAIERLVNLAEYAIEKK